MVKVLLGDMVEADVAAKDEDGKTALDWAALNGHKEVVELLERSNDDHES